MCQTIVPDISLRSDDYDNAKMDTLCRTPDIVNRNKKETKEKSSFCPFFNKRHTESC